MTNNGKNKIPKPIKTSSANMNIFEKFDEHIIRSDVFTEANIHISSVHKHNNYECENIDILDEIDATIDSRIINTHDYNSLASVLRGTDKINGFFDEGFKIMCCHGGWSKFNMFSLSQKQFALVSVKLNISNEYLLVKANLVPKTVNKTYTIEAIKDFIVSNGYLDELTEVGKELSDARQEVDKIVNKKLKDFISNNYHFSIFLRYLSDIRRAFNYLHSQTHSTHSNNYNTDNYDTDKYNIDSYSILVDKIRLENEKEVEVASKIIKRYKVAIMLLSQKLSDFYELDYLQTLLLSLLAFLLPTHPERKLCRCSIITNIVKFINNPPYFYLS